MGTEWFDEPKGDPPVVVDPDSAWEARGREWAQRLREALAPLDVAVDHVGSTAVPGLPAKPVLDLQVAVPDLADEAAYRPGLESLGLVLRARAADHRFFRPPASEPRTVHVHVCERGSAWEHDHVRFRDRLREDPALAAEYAELKRALSAASPDRAAYAEGKRAFIERTLSDPASGAGASPRTP